eukprot:364615-Chlamydomonas_euryale.AAC.23
MQHMSFGFLCGIRLSGWRRHSEMARRAWRGVALPKQVRAYRTTVVLRTDYHLQLTNDNATAGKLLW